MKIIAGVVIILIVIAFGFIRVDTATWQHYRLLFPAGAGIGIAVGLNLILWGLVGGKHSRQYAELKEALKPFAEEMYDEQGKEFLWFAGMDDSSAAFTAWGVHCDLVAGDFRRAALAYRR